MGLLSLYFVVIATVISLTSFEQACCGDVNKPDFLGERLREYSLVTPICTDSEGHYISHLLSAKHKRRFARDLSHNSKLYFNITVFGSEYHLRLRSNSHLVAPGAVVEWQEDLQQTDSGTITGHNLTKSNIMKIWKKEPLVSDCAYVGGITDIAGASVAINNCDGLSGMIRTDKEEYFIEPAERGMQEEERSGRVHVVYRRSAVKHIFPDTFTNFHFSDSDLLGTGKLDTMYDSIGQKMNETMRMRRHLGDNDYNIEVLLGVDDSVVRFHGKEHVQNYLLTLMNIVNEIYHDESLGVHINVVLVRMVMLGYAKDSTAKSARQG